MARARKPSSNAHAAVPRAAPAQAGVTARAPGRGRKARAAPTVPADDARAEAGISVPARWLIPLALVAVTGAAYLNSFAGAFLFDDASAIVDNKVIRQLWPPWAAMAGTSRPLVMLSLAFNYALGGLDPWGYHAFNLAVHVGAALALYGIVRRMLGSESLRPRYAAPAPWLAGAAALIWAVHPLQTESVTYVIQRAESMMGLFLLLTLYCAIRSASSPQRWRWQVAAVLACALGMGSKEVMVVAPVLVLLYDRMFIARSWRDILLRRGWLHAGLAATWLALAFLVASSPGGQERQLVLVEGLTPWRYALTQFGVIVHYLRLALWPHPLVFDYAWPLTGTVAAALPYAAVVAALVAATLWALARRHWAGYWGAWFFVILSPTSSVVVIADPAFEHRMYLPLAAVAVLVVIATHRALAWAQQRLGAPDALRRRLQAGLMAAAIAALALTTFQRNNDYRSELAIWTDTLAKRPDNPRARHNMGMLLFKEERFKEAIAQLSEAVRLHPTYWTAHFTLGNAHDRDGNTADAIASFAKVISLNPGFGPAYVNLGRVLAMQGKFDEAGEQYAAALRLDPADAVARNALGAALASQGKLDAAVAQYAEAVRLNPGNADAQRGLGAALYRLGKLDEAIAHMTRVVELQPNDAVARNNLGVALGSAGKTDEARAQFAEAVRLKPDYADARDNLRRAEAARQPVKTAP